MSEKVQREVAVVDALVEGGLVDAARQQEAVTVVGRVLGAPMPGTAAPAEGARGRLVEVAGYLGGSLVVAAAGLFLLDRWPDLSVTQQVWSLAGIAIVLAVAGLAVGAVGGGLSEIRGGRDGARRRLSGSLLVAGALAASFAVSLQVDELVTGYGSESTLAWAITLTILAAAAYAIAPTALGLLGIAVGVFTIVPAALDLAGVVEDGPAFGLLQLLLAAVWVGLTEAGVFGERLAARTIGMAWALVGAQLLLVDGDVNYLAYLATAVVGALGFWGYLAKQVWPYLAGGVIAVTIVVPEAIIDWTDGSLGVAGGILVAGLTLLAASLIGFRVRQEATGDTKTTEDTEAGPAAGAK